MRDIVLSLIVFGMIPFILARPHLGVYMWSWLSYMNPHRLAWGFAVNFPFVQVTAIALAIGAIFSREKKSFPVCGPTVLWALFTIWVCVTTVFATNPEPSQDYLERVLKIQFGTLMTLLLIVDRSRLEMLVWTIVISIGFYGVKGGIFAAQGTPGLVWGPRGTFIEGNNELALAVLMTIPFMRFLQLQAQDRRVSWAMAAIMALSIFAVAGSYSRGAFLAAACMFLFLWWKGKNRFITAIVGLLFLGLVLASMPQKWWDRMSTIQTYDEDASAQGRLDAWETAIGIANARPIVGGGFLTFTPESFRKYGGGADLARDVHSIYFQVLGEHGYVGLLLFLAMILGAWRLGSRVIRAARTDDSLAWHADLARMAQVSLIAYLAGGAFLGLAYFDLPYHVVAVLVLVERLSTTARPIASGPDACPPRHGLPVAELSNGGGIGTSMHRAGPEDKRYACRT